MKDHDLKCWPEYFIPVVLELKPFEVRKNDRDFRVDDRLILREWVPVIGKYTGRWATVLVTYILEGEPLDSDQTRDAVHLFPDQVIAPGYVVMGIKLLNRWLTPTPEGS